MYKRKRKFELDNKQASRPNTCHEFHPVFLFHLHIRKHILESYSILKYHIVYHMLYFTGKCYPISVSEMRGCHQHSEYVQAT